MSSLQASGPCESPSRRSAIRVLHVEDDPELAALVERRLRWCLTQRFEITRVGNLGEAVGRIEEKACDLLLLDLELPDGGGAATLAVACALARHLPIVVLTSHDDDALAAFARRAGASDYLVKQRLDRRSLVSAIVGAFRRGPVS